MKRLLAALFTTALALAATGALAVTFSDYRPGDAASGIAGSRHNLGSLGNYTITADTSEVCIFCHTPHNGDPAARPLWNRSTANSTTYTAYGTTIADTLISNGDLGSVTLACLSCHDGVTTFDNLVNSPGKGNGTGDQGWTFTEDGTIASDFLTDARLVIGPSLSNDHPVSVPYSPGKASLRSTDTIISMVNLTTGLGSTNANITQNLWAVKGFFNSNATIADLLRENANMGGLAVECSSCHDPHFSNKSFDEVEWTWGGENYSDGFFLRRVGGNVGSGVCRTCHNK